MKTFAIYGKIKDGRNRRHPWRKVCREIKAYSLKQAVSYFKKILYPNDSVWIIGYVDLDL